MNAFFANPFSTKIARKLLFAFLLCALLPILLIALLSYSYVKMHLQKINESEMRRNCSDVAVYLNRMLKLQRELFADYVASYRRKPETNAGNGADPVSDDRQNGFVSIVREAGNSIKYLHGSRMIIPELTPEDEEYLQREQVLFKLFFYNDTPNLYLVSKHADGYFYGKLNYFMMFRALQQTCGSWRCQCVILTDKQQLIYPFKCDDFEKAKLLAVTNSSTGNSFRMPVKGHSFIGVQKYLTDESFFGHSKGRIVMLRDTAVIFEPLYKYNGYFFSLLTIAVAAVVLLCIYVVRGFNHNIKVLYAATREIAHRNFRYEVAIDSNDEFHSLALAFNRMSEELRHTTISKEELAVTLRSIVDGVIVTDREDHVTFMNQAAEQMTGWTEDDASGRSLLDVFTIKGIEEPAALVAASGVPAVQNGEHDNLSYERGLLTNRDGEILPVSYNAANIEFDSADERIGDVIVFRDMTGQEEMESQLRQMQKMEAIGTLAGGIAHDFNNILGVIFGFLELTELGIRKEDTETLDNINQITQAAKRAQDLVMQILAFCRRSNIEKKPVSLIPLVKEITKMLRSTLPSTINIKLVIDTEHCQIMADPTQIHQILMNLCTNAFHAMREAGGTLTISLTALSRDEVKTRIREPLTNKDATRFINIKVADNGCGIEPGKIERIFDPYFTTKSTGEGTGLGLSVVKGIVGEHAGQIAVKSRPGLTEFDIFLPLIEVEKPENEAMPGETPQFRKGSGKILLVDDDHDLLDTNKRMLEYLGYQVTAMTDSVEAFNEFIDNPYQFDALITDQTMPHLTGIQLAKRMIRIRPDMPVILSTGYSESVSEESVKGAGIALLMHKPFNIKDLSVALQSVMAPSLN